MSTPDQSDTSQLTRKQMREQQRETGAVPIAVPQNAAAAPVAYPPVPPLPRPAEPAVLPPAPVPDASVDLGVSPLTRRQARQQERIRTASVPVITPEVAAAHTAAMAASAAAAAPQSAFAPITTPTAPASEPDTLTAASSLRSLFDTTDEHAPVAAPEAPRTDSADPFSSLGGGITPPPAPTGDRPTVGSAFGAALIGGAPAPSAPAADPAPAVASAPVAPAPKAPTPTPPAPSPASTPAVRASEPAADQADDPFERVLSRDTSSGSTGASPHTLIVSQNPTAGPISAPLSGTGEVLVTGTYALPDGLGSLGHVPGAADGKEVDATLVDGELPVHSSPTPIAASAAVSTAKGQDELIRPPAPEKGSKLMLTLAITAGALALALVGVLIVAFATGVFSQ
ncbi:hypothetical protein [Microbacterium candidum]|uniref:Uncharacterized protein n=1 Tax=Microbacterium candidum TaxID=3041922 RepID=A0ABT7MYT7_9MICO|nr:hypothetical protein [Microbacterium sp. ASV49]MDL9979613.1 hypothetical protein [Microbacterium sp. ASV49]